MVDSLSTGALAANSSVSSATGVPTSDASTISADFNTFLTLLTAQLKNQDPLDPQDGTEFTAQLAQFSSLEQQINTNTKLDNLIGAQPDPTQDQAMNYIGKDVLAKNSNITLGETGIVEFTYDIDQPIQSTNIQILNAEGELVREFSGSSAEGIHNVAWDGKDEAGNRLESGNYTIKVDAAGATNASGDTINTTLNTYVYSRATEVTQLGSKYMVLTENGKYNELGDIIAARESAAAPTSPESKHATALQMLGKEILIPGNDFTYVPGESKGFTYGITKDIQAVSVTITDADGNQIKQVPFESTKGSHEYVWDGTDANGDPVPAGEYNIEINGQDIDGEGVVQEEKLDVFYYGTAEKVEAQGSSVVLYTTDGRTAFYEDIISTKEKSN